MDIRDLRYDIANFCDNLKHSSDLKKAEKKWAEFVPNDNKNLKEFFDLAKPLGALIAIKTKNMVYVRVNTYNIFVPPEIHELAKKFDLNFKFGCLDKRSNIYYANAKRHAIEIHE